MHSFCYHLFCADWKSSGIQNLNSLSVLPLMLNRQILLLVCVYWMAGGGGREGAATQRGVGGTGINTDSDQTHLCTCSHPLTERSCEKRRLPSSSWPTVIKVSSSRRVLAPMIQIADNLVLSEQFSSLINTHFIWESSQSLSVIFIVCSKEIRGNLKPCSPCTSPSKLNLR